MFELSCKSTLTFQWFCTRSVVEDALNWRLFRSSLRVWMYIDFICFDHIYIYIYIFVWRCIYPPSCNRGKASSSSGKARMKVSVHSACLCFLLSVCVVFNCPPHFRFARSRERERGARVLHFIGVNWMRLCVFCESCLCVIRCWMGLLFHLLPRSPCASLSAL